jgi:hypothetical protein
MIITSPLVREYIRNDSGRSNEFTVPYARDHTKRILSPLDEAVVVHYTDEGYEILVKGRVRKVDDYQELIYCEVDNNFKGYGFEDGWFDANKAIRFPSGWPKLEYELMVFFGSVNTTTLYGRNPHKNGKALRLG